MSYQVTCEICGDPVPTDYNGTIPSDWGTCSISITYQDPSNANRLIDKMPLKLHICAKHPVDLVPVGALERDLTMALVNNLMPVTPEDQPSTNVSAPAAVSPDVPPAEVPLPTGQIPRAIAS